MLTAINLNILMLETKLYYLLYNIYQNVFKICLLYI